MQETILILDFGSQFTQLIARRVREAGVYSEVVPFYSASAALLRPYNNIKGIILSGGPSSVHEQASPRAPEEIFNYGVPILGLCYGEQLLCAQLGGQVTSAAKREYGKAFINIKESCALFDGVWRVGENYQVWMSHSDHITQIPVGFKVVATSANAPFAAIVDEKRRFYGTQFHMEVVHTPDGAELIRNFLRSVCGCVAQWSMASFRTEAIARIRQQVGSERVVCGLSGGVDSTVTAVLLHEAIGAQLSCIFVDHGLLRKNEAEEVTRLFRETYNIDLIHVNAETCFLDALSGIVDPEEKRKIIGGLFIEIFEAEAKKNGGADFLAQGTLYPDVIESVSFTGGPSVTIKSHHNVGGLPARMKMQLVEPLRNLFKDEVRALGVELGLPGHFVGRHPFPGPGLAIRLPGGVTKKNLAILREADAIYLEEIRHAGLYDKIWQAFAVLLPVHTVGVMGDSRTYDQVLALRAVTSQDGMTAESYDFGHQFLTHTATRIVNEVKGISRVVYDVTSKPPGTIEWE